jgi:hypothetical protein
MFVEAVAASRLQVSINVGAGRVELVVAPEDGNCGSGRGIGASKSRRLAGATGVQSLMPPVHDTDVLATEQHGPLATEEHGRTRIFSHGRTRNNTDPRAFLTFM